MKKINLIFIIVFTYWHSIAQKIEVHIFPAFHYYSKFTANCINDSCRTEFNIFDRRDTSKIIWSEKKIISFCKIKQLMHYLENYELSGKIEKIGFDGINFEYKYSDITGVKEFRFWSPLKHTKDYEMFKMTLFTLNQIFKTRHSEKYLRKLKLYLN